MATYVIYDDYIRWIKNNQDVADAYIVYRHKVLSAE